jgi:hypothetical protein
MEVLIMTKNDFYDFIANLIDIIVLVFMFTLVYDIFTGTALDLITDGVAVIVMIAIENILKGIIKIDDNIED